MRVACMCHCGVTRSVGIAWYLREHGRHETLPIPWWPHLINDDTIAMVCEWAEKIILAQPGFVDRIPIRFRPKVLVWDVGPDEGRYGHALNPELQENIAVLAARDGF